MRRLSNVGSTLAEYTGVAGNTFYENELSRESIGHNNNLLAIGTNTNDINSESKLQIFDVLDDSSVKLAYTYDKFDDDGKGITGKMFEEEDWSHIDLKKLFVVMSDRMTKMFPVNNRLIIQLRAKNG